MIAKIVRKVSLEMIRYAQTPRKNEIGAQEKKILIGGKYMNKHILYVYLLENCHGKRIGNSKQ